MNRIAPRERMGIAAILSAMALVVLDSGMIGVALPTLADSIGGTPSRSLMVVGAYQLGLLSALLPCAHAADRFGYRRLFVAGVALFGCASLLCALAPTLPLLVAARFVQGLGGAAIMSLGIALLRFALGADRLGAAIAWNALVVAICSALAPMAGALILSIAGWRLIFVVGVPLAAVALLAASALPAVRGTGRADPLSMTLYAAAAACLVGAVELARDAPILAIAVAAGALSCACWLLARERRKRAPLVPFDLLALRPFRKSVTASIFFFTAQSMGLLALAFHVQVSMGRSAAATGLLLALWPLAVVATSSVASRLAARFAPGPVCAAGGMLLAAGLACTALWPVGVTIAPLAACALACGAGFGLFQLSNNRNMFLTAPAGRSAAAGGLQGTARLAGQTAGALLVSSVLSVAPMALAPRVAIGLAAVAALIAAFVSWTGNVSEPVDADAASQEPPGRATAAAVIP